MSLVTEQPPPEPSDRPAVWDLVLADMQARDAEGRRKYGVPLQPDNGRDALTDAYQEALDLCAYLRQAIYERDEADADLRQHKEERLRLRVENLRLTKERDEARAYAEERNDEANEIQRYLNMAATERDEARAEVERLRALKPIGTYSMDWNHEQERLRLISELEKVKSQRDWYLSELRECKP